MPQKTMNSEVLVDFLDAYPILDPSLLAADLPDEVVMTIAHQKGWTMYFNGSSRSPIGKKIKPLG